MRNEDERRKHHGEIPIIDAARCATAVLHKPSLERTEKQNADHITNAVCEADQNQEPPINEGNGVENADHGVEREPSDRNAERFSAAL